MNRVLLLLVLFACGCAHHRPTVRHASRSHARDHRPPTSAHAAREVAATAPTAQDQQATPSDVEITRRIRSSVVQDRSLSMRARNVTIVTEDGVVTLRGNVESEREKRTIERYAHDLNGGHHVSSSLTVEP